MNDEYGVIKVTELDKGKVEYSWEGNSIVTQISIRSLFHIEAMVGKQGIDYIENGKRIRIGPYKLKMLEKRYDFGGGIYRRINGDFNIRLRSFLIMIRWWFNLINRRLLTTFNVWNLMEVELGVVPTWKDFKIFRKKK